MTAESRRAEGAGDELRGVARDRAGRAGHAREGDAPDGDGHGVAPRVLVTAAASGIGGVVAARFAAAGAKVHVCDVADEALAAFAAGHPGIGASRADVADPGDVDRLFEDALAGLGGLDVLVSNAGIAGPVGPVEDMDVEAWRRTLDVNLTGAFLCARRAVPALKRSGGGSIVLMSSNAGTMGLPYRGPYVATKWALIGFAKTLAMELGPAGIRVNAVCPGDVDGERIRRVIALEAAARGIGEEEVVAERVAAVSLRTMVTADDVAELIMFVCSAAGAKISGQALLVDGNAERA
jgi:NAD(P)-dependent dehydrogenase (short-subunit alcohol dehydrogenase family)